MGFLSRDTTAQRNIQHKFEATATKREFSILQLYKQYLTNLQHIYTYWGWDPNLLGQLSKGKLISKELVTPIRKADSTLPNMTIFQQK